MGANNHATCSTEHACRHIHTHVYKHVYRHIRKTYSYLVECFQFSIDPYSHPHRSDQLPQTHVLGVVVQGCGCWCLLVRVSVTYEPHYQSPT